MQVYKGLELLAPWYAEKLLNKPVEGPVFVSPVIKEPNVCPYEQCGVRYTPLVYELGERTYAQHVHASGGDGGLYVTETPDQTIGDWVCFGLADDPYRGHGAWKCRMFLMQTPPIPRYIKCTKIIEAMGNLIPCPPDEHPSGAVYAGTVNLETGQLSFPLETWQRWVEQSEEIRRGNSE